MLSSRARLRLVPRKVVIVDDESIDRTVARTARGVPLLRSIAVCAVLLEAALGPTTES